MRHKSRDACLLATPFLLLTALTILGCADDAQVVLSRPPPSITPTPYVRPGLQPAVVTRVVDGDTIRVQIDGEEYRVRYIGIDTPETGESGSPAECFSREATERNRELVAGRTVGLERDVSETDTFDRLLRYVWIEDRMVNAALLEGGFALASTYPPDVKNSELFAYLQAQAREASRGLWGAACATAVEGSVVFRTFASIVHVRYNALVYPPAEGR